MSFPIRLTDEEALTLALLAKAGHGGGFVSESLDAIVKRLEEMQPGLDAKQRTVWDALGCPDFDLTPNPQKVERATVQ